ncbi:MAG TPA: class I SAM-dependent methyltransferase [Pyrinomonadaceae bacterium]|nr:class I SAM-dependent methyltransferase [Pyrinomonadaceae bacterium]
MNDRTAWHEDDDFWCTFAPQIMFGEQAWQRARSDVDQLTTLLPTGAAVLDLCCGPGRHALELARRGFRVTALDRTAFYLDQARAQAGTEGLEIEFVCDDMRQFVRPDSFDAIINLSTSFGFFEDPADDRKVIENAHRSLREHGLLIMDMKGKEVLARSFVERTWFEQDDKLFLLKRTVKKDWSWVEDLWIMLENGTRRQFVMAHRPYSAAELRLLLESCSFNPIIQGDLTGAKYDHNASRLVAVARRRMDSHDSTSIGD